MDYLLEFYSIYMFCKAFAYPAIYVLSWHQWIDQLTMSLDCVIEICSSLVLNGRLASILRYLYFVRHLLILQYFISLTLMYFTTWSTCKIILLITLLDYIFMTWSISIRHLPTLHYMYYLDISSLMYIL